MTQTASPKRPKPTKHFLGKLQPVTSRVPAVPPVNFAKGGSDFRCPLNTSSFGRQTVSGEHRNTQPVVRFGAAPRFNSSETLGVGPAAVGQISSMKRQPLSNRPSASSMNFGTSTRDGAWKLYAIYTEKRF
eukprot:gene35242-42691_t